MTMIQNIGLFGLNLLVGWANNYGHADATNPAGYNLGMWIFSILGVLGVVFAFLLRQRELGPHGHGLETITTASSKGLIESCNATNFGRLRLFGSSPGLKLGVD